MKLELSILVLVLLMVGLPSFIQPVDIVEVEREFDRDARFDQYLKRHVEMDPPHVVDEVQINRSDLDRDHWQSADQIMAGLELSRGMVVADIGTGGGYYALRMAPWVRLSGLGRLIHSDQGIVYAQDINRDRLSLLHHRIQSIKREEPWLPVDNIRVFQADARDTGLLPDTVDLALLSNAHFFALPGPDDFWRPCMESLVRALKIGARVAVIENDVQALDICFSDQNPRNAANLAEFPVVQFDGREMCAITSAMIIRRFARVGLTFSHQLDPVKNSQFLMFVKAQ